MSRYLKCTFLLVLWFTLGLNPVEGIGQVDLCVDELPFLPGMTCEEFFFRSNNSGNRDYFVRLVTYAHKSSGGNILPVINFVNTPEEERRIRVHFHFLDFFYKKGNNYSRDNSKLTLKIKLDELIFARDKLNLLSPANDLTIVAGEYEDNLAFTNVRNPSAAYIEFSLQPGYWDKTEIDISILIREGASTEKTVRLIVPIRVELPPPSIPGDTCKEQYLSKGLSGWCACLSAADSSDDCKERARQRIAQREAELWQQTKVAGADSKAVTVEVKAALEKKIAALVEYSEAAGICRQEHWPKPERIKSVEGDKRTLEKRLAEVDKAFEEIEAERKAWDALQQKVRQFKEEGRSLAEIEALYQAFLDGGAVRSVSNYRPEAERIIQEGQYKAINRTKTDSLDWVVYTYQNVKRIIVSRDPLNDNNWEVDYSLMGAEPPQLKVRKIAVSESYRLFIYDEEWEKTDTLNLGDPFQAQLDQADSTYYFSFVGGVGPYSLYLRLRDESQQTIWQEINIDEANYALTKDSLVASLQTAAVKLKGDSLQVAFVVTEGKSEKIYPVTNGGLLIANPQFSNSGLVIALSLLALLIIGVLVFILMRRRNRNRQPVHQQHQYN